MRRPLNSELSPEDRLLAQRWAISVGALYSTIIAVIIAAVLASGTSSPTDKVNIVAASERKTYAGSGERTDDHAPAPTWTGLRPTGLEGRK